MRYCKRKQGNVADHRCKPLKHPECANIRVPMQPIRMSRAKNQRKGYCHYDTIYIACDHDYCRFKQGENLMSLVSGITQVDEMGTIRKIGRNAKSSRPRIGRNNVKVSAFKTNVIAKSTGQPSKSRNWKRYKSLAEYMAAGK